MNLNRKLEMPSFKEIEKSKEIFPAEEDDQPEPSAFMSEELLDLATQLCQNQIVRCQSSLLTRHKVLTDLDDFDEFREMLELSTSKSTPGRGFEEDEQIYDVARLLIQEKGEEDYEYLFKKKSQDLVDKLND